MNITPQYKKYLEDARAAGLSDVQIRTALLGAGWTESQVGDLFFSYNSMNSPAPSVPVPVELVKSSLAHPDEHVVNETNSHELARRQNLTPQVEPQELRPHISHAAYVPKEQTIVPVQKIVSDQFQPTTASRLSPAEQPSPFTLTQTAVVVADPIPTQTVAVNQMQGAGIASYQTGSQLNSPIQKNTQSQSIYAGNSPATSGMNRSVISNNPGARIMADGRVAAAGAVFTEGKTGGASVIKKIFFTILALAFFVGSGGYAYMQFVDPFILVSDEDLLANAITNFVDGANNIDVKTQFELYTGESKVGGFMLDITQKVEEGKIKAASLRMHDVFVNPENELFALPSDSLIEDDVPLNEIGEGSGEIEGKEVEAGFEMPNSFITSELEEIIKNLDIRYIFVNSILYVYPSALIKLLPLEQETLDSLFETWIVFDDIKESEDIANNFNVEFEVENVKKEFNNFFTKENLPEYTLTSSIENKEKHIHISIAPEAMKSFLRKNLERLNGEASQETTESLLSESQYQVDIKVVITADRQIKSTELTIRNLEDDMKTIIRSEVNFLDTNIPPILAPKKTINIKDLNF